MERAKFSDETIEITDIPTNTPAAGAPTISDLTPVEGQELTAAIGTVSDGDGIAPGSLAFAWQSEIDPGFWTTVGSGTTFTPGPDEVGLALRVVATFQDGDGVLESANSAATAAVENLNDAPTGAPVLDDTTPSEGAQIVSSTTGIRDLDGLEGVAFAHQWQTSGDGGATWADIGGATAAAFTPTAAQVGLRLRDRVTFTDNNGTAEAVASDMTAAGHGDPAGPGAAAVGLRLGPGAPSPRALQAGRPARRRRERRRRQGRHGEVHRAEEHDAGAGARLQGRLQEPAGEGGRPGQARPRHARAAPPVDRPGPPPRRDVPDRDDARRQPHPVGRDDGEADLRPAVAPGGIQAGPHRPASAGRCAIRPCGAPPGGRW